MSMKEKISAASRKVKNAALSAVPENNSFGDFMVSYCVVYTGLLVGMSVGIRVFLSDEEA